MIYTLILFTNGMIGAFDRNGEQMPQFQGKASDVIFSALSILRQLDKYGTISIRDWNSQQSIAISREQFELFCEAWL